MDAMSLKSGDPPQKKSTSRALLRQHIKFRLRSSIWRGVMRGINLKHEENQQTNYVFKAVKGYNEYEKFKFPKDIFLIRIKPTYQILTT